MPSPIYFVHSRKVKKHGRIRVERSGEFFRVKIEGRVVQDWAPAFTMDWLKDLDVAFFNECGFKTV